MNKKNQQYLILWSFIWNQHAWILSSYCHDCWDKKYRILQPSWADDRPKNCTELFTNFKVFNIMIIFEKCIDMSTDVQVFLVIVEIWVEQIEKMNIKKKVLYSKTNFLDLSVNPSKNSWCVRGKVHLHHSLCNIKSNSCII